MLIVKRDVLSERLDRVHYKGELFSGVALEIGNNEITNKVHYKLGQEVGKYIEPFTQLRHGSSIDYSLLEEEFEGAGWTYKGDYFSGITYSFRADLCLAERQYEGGLMLEEFVYHEGSVSKYWLRQDDELILTAQLCDWFENGGIKGYVVNKGREIGISIGFESKNVISGLRINGSYFEKLDALTNEIRYPMFQEVGFAKSLVGASTVTLLGSGLDNEIFTDLISDNGLSRTEQLEIHKTAVDGEGIQQLISCKTVKFISVQSDIINLGNMKTLKRARPDCFIRLNYNEVTA